MPNHGSAYTSRATILLMVTMSVFVACGGSKQDSKRGGEGKGSEMSEDSDSSSGFGDAPKEVEPADRDIEVPPAP
jgi:hypothetical protein